MASEKARSLRKRMTPQEVKLWVKLRQLRELGFHFRRQSPVLAFIVDFEGRRQRLIVEVDGGQHGRHENAAADAARDRALENAGYRILRFWNNQIEREVEGVIETILAVLAKGAPPGSLRSPPSPLREEG
jgi:very-short-patch-repair endonuclease